MITFAETSLTYPDGQLNVVAVPNPVMLTGFVPKQLGVRGQPLTAQSLNYLFREAFRQINRDLVRDGNGANMTGTFDTGAVTLFAVVKTDVSKFIHAIGYKSSGNPCQFKVLSNNVLTLGTVTPTGTVINGAPAADIIIRFSIRD